MKGFRLERCCATGLENVLNPAFGHDAIHLPVVFVHWRIFDDLAFVGEANACSVIPGKKAVEVTAAIAEAVTVTGKSQAGHKTHRGLRDGQVLAAFEGGFEDAERTGPEVFDGAQTRPAQIAPGSDDGDMDGNAAFESGADDGQGIHFVVLGGNVDQERARLLET